MARAKKEQEPARAPEPTEEEKQAASDEIITRRRQVFVDGFDDPFDIYDVTPSIRQRADAIYSRAALEAIREYNYPKEEDFIDAHIAAGTLPGDFREQLLEARASASQAHLRAMRTNKPDDHELAVMARKKVGEMTMKISTLVAGSTVESFSSVRRAAYLCAELCYHNGERVWENVESFLNDDRGLLKDELVFAVIFRDQGMDESFFVSLRESLAGGADTAQAGD